MTKNELPDAFVWTKMQSDGGEGIGGIRWRKELERLAGNGTFWWGIGESKSKAINLLLQKQPRPIVVFSLMRSQPHSRSVGPDGVFLWQSYLTPHGKEALPAHIIVTSGAQTQNGTPKRNYCALVCKSQSSILSNGGGILDARALRNFGSARPVGNSQVTAAVERVSATGPAYEYPITAWAELVTPYATTLADPRELSPTERKFLVDSDKNCSTFEDWLAVARQLRRT